MNIAELIIKVIIALSLGYGLYRDSRGRDYSWSFWTLVPLVIFILSPPVMVGAALVGIIVFYLILRPKGLMLKCPHCGKKIHEILTICPFCRKDAKKECLHCHEPVPWEAEQCPFCKSRALTQG
jgi:endogenous inhibitor of DNA gyrase (YacG/DUF329 family)